MYERKKNNLKMDVLFISPGNASGIYQKLSKDYSAIEPPTWALLLSQSCRSVGYKVGLIDINAEKLNKESVIESIKYLNPRLICFVVYGQNVNSGIVNMSGSVFMSNYIKEVGIKIPICYIGSYVQALPIKSLNDELSIDFVFTNEGVYALRNLLSTDLSDLSKIKGIAWRKGDEIIMNHPEKIVPNERMDIDLPGYAWDLLPFKESPLDLYRAPMWHAEYDQNKRTPYAAIQTSLGCSFTCDFCMVNIINRNDNDEIGVASNYNIIRHWSPEFIISEFEKLIDMKVYTIKITDELFFSNKNYFVPLCEMIRDKGYGDKLLMWAYSRIDYLNTNLLKLIRSAGIKWLALGIESGSKNVRLDVSKGKFENNYIKKFVNDIHDADISIMANYIFGLPGDTIESMKETLDLSIELNTDDWCGYPAITLPGSKLYKDAILKDIKLPKFYDEFSFHGYNTLPVETGSLSASDILNFRDNAYDVYHNNPIFLEKIKNKFGQKAVNNILEMLEVKLERKILKK